MAWAETSKNIYERPLFPGELFTAALQRAGNRIGQHNWRLFSSVTFESQNGASKDELSNQFRTTWKQCRYFYPLVAATQADDTTVRYRVANSETVELWAKQTFIIEDDKTTVDGLLTRVEQPEYPQLHFLPQTNQLVLDISHLHQDALGIAQFWQAFFSHFDNPQEVNFGDEQKNLGGPWTDQFPRLAGSAEGQKVGENAVQDFVSRLPAIGFKAKELAAASDGKRTFRTLDPNTTRKLVAKTKQLKTTVSSFMMATFLEAIINHPDATRLDTGQYTGPAFYNLRKYLPDSKPHPMGQLYLAQGIFVKTGEFERMLAEVTQAYRRNLVEEAKTLESISTFYGAVIPVAEILASPDGLPKDDFLFSPIGKLDGHLMTDFKTLRVTDFTFSIKAATSNLGIHIWTFNDRFSLNVGYNEASHSTEQMESLVNSWLEIVHRRLAADD